MALPLRHYLEFAGRSAEQYRRIFARARELRRLRSEGERPETLRGKTLAFYFEKPSARTRVSFEAAALELGARCMDVPSGANLFPRYTALADLAQMLSAYSDGVVFRTGAHDRVHTLAGASRVPVINGASDAGHPARTLSDVFAMGERAIGSLRVAFVGDGTSMTARSFIEAAGAFGFELRVASPAGYAPAAPGDKVLVTTDPREAVRKANVVVCDSWTVVSSEALSKDRMQVFAGFQIDAALLKHCAVAPVVMHCLPPHRGREISADVYDKHAAGARDEAEGRLHVQKALLEDVLLRPELPGAKLWAVLSKTERDDATAALANDAKAWGAETERKSILRIMGEGTSQVLGARRENGVLVVLATQSCTLWYSAQSGSDWGEHHARVVEAVFDKGEKRAQSTLGEYSVQLSEREYDDYSAVAAVRDFADKVLFERGLL